MSAASPKTQEPSMEEILASIRRIIADDQKEAEMANLAAARPAPVPEPEPEDEEDILDLAGVAEPVRKPPLEDEPEIAFKDEPDFDAIEIEPPAPPPPAPPKAAAPPRPEPAPIPAPAPEPAPERLISKDTDASVSQAFHLLAHTVLTNNARTLEDLVQDMLRPMLKAWLDDNLPAMVERLVRAEIERVARGR